jgi:hypothetical protein
MLDGYFVESRRKDGGESRFRISAVQPLSKCSLLSRPGPFTPTPSTSEVRFLHHRFQDKGRLPAALTAFIFREVINEYGPE